MDTLENQDDPFPIKGPMLEQQEIVFEIHHETADFSCFVVKSTLAELQQDGVYATRESYYLFIE